MNFTYTKGWGEQYFTYFYFFAGGTLSQVQSTNNWYKSSNLTYNLILNESTLSLTCYLYFQRIGNYHLSMFSYRIHLF